MGNTMKIEPYVFSILFYLWLLAWGVDASLSGIIILLSARDKPIQPILLSLFFIGRVQMRMKKYKGRNKYIKFLNNPRIMAFYFLMAGIMTILGSIMMIMINLQHR